MNMKNKLQSQGWTPEIVRERLVGIRDNARAFRAMKGSAQYSYRFLNVCQYLRHRSMLSIFNS